MLSERTAQAEQRPKLARFGEMVRIIAPARSSAVLTRGLPATADPEIYFILADPPFAG
jgi:hypothetical protein